MLRVCVFVSIQLFLPPQKRKVKVNNHNHYLDETTWSISQNVLGTMRKGKKKWSLLSLGAPEIYIHDLIFVRTIHFKLSVQKLSNTGYEYSSMRLCALASKANCFLKRVHFHFSIFFKLKSRQQCKILANKYFINKFRRCLLIQ